MPSQAIPIPMPDRGISDDTSFTDQPPLTTREALNNRATESRTGRKRHTQRSGLDTYIASDGQLSGTNFVQDLVQVTKNEDLLTYALDATPDNVFGKKLPGPNAGSSTSFQGDCVDIHMDDFGDVYVAQRVSGVFKYNQAGEKLADILIPDASSGGQVEISCFAVDEFGNVAIGLGGSSASITDCKLHFFQNQPDGAYELKWTIDSGNAFTDVAFYQGTIYTTEIDTLFGAPFTSGDFAYFRVYPNYTTVLAPDEDTSKRVDISTPLVAFDALATGCVPLRMAVREDGVVYITGQDGTTTANGTGTITFICRVNPNADTPTTFAPATWVYTSTATDQGGMGGGIALAPKNSLGQFMFYTYGPVGTVGTDTNHIRRVIDTGVAAAFTGTDTWEQALGVNPLQNPITTKPLRIDTDVDGNLYISPLSTSGDIVRIYAVADGTELGSFDESTADGANGGGQIAISKEAKPVGSAEEEVELVFYGTIQAVTGSLAFFCNRMLTVTQGSGSMRSLVTLGVSNGDIVKFSTASAAAATGGSGVLDTSAPFVQSVAFGLFAYFTDGKNYFKYSIVDDAVTAWISTTSSLIPPRCRLLETWRGRVLLGRDPEDPQLWHASAVGDANNWDNFPPTPVVTQAISGINAKAGKMPDIVNSIVPWDDDLCLFGGDKSIWRLTGDPLAGGQFDLVSDETGMAFGRCWTKDPVGGRLFFAGSRGGVYMMERNSLPVRISVRWIERRLQDDVDYSQYYLRLVWNYRDEGLHVFQCPFLGNGGTIVKHWFWDAKHAAEVGGGWWEDQFGSTALGTELQPTSVLVVDGDTASDRKLLFGCEDGRVRVWDETRVDDRLTSSTDYPIVWKLVLGPILPANQPIEYKFRRFTAVLASDQSGCGYKFSGQDHGDTVGPTLYSGSLNAGRNASSPAIIRASNMYLTLTNSMLGQRCAVESMLIHAAPAGRVKVRA